MNSSRSVAKMIETIETEMDAPTVETAEGAAQQAPAAEAADEAVAAEAADEAVADDASDEAAAADEAAPESTAPDAAADDEAATPAPVAPEEGVNPEHLRMVEALLFAASEPLDAKALATSLPEGADVKGVIAQLQALYEKRGVNLCAVAGKYQFRTAADLAFLLRKEKPEQKRLSKAAIETLAIIAYHQPVTRAEIEDIRGVALSKGTLDTLMEVGWVKIRGRKRTPGRPVTYGTSEAFLVQFGLESVGHLPGLDELKAAGFLEAMPPSGFDVPNPSEGLGPDEDPYDPNEPDAQGDMLTGSPHLDQA